MLTLADIIQANPDATHAKRADLFNAQPPTPKPSSPDTYATYLSIDERRRELFDEDAGDVVSKLEAGLKQWADAPDLSLVHKDLPTPGRITRVHTRLSGYPGIDLSSEEVPAILALLASGFDADHPSLLTSQQAAALLSIGWHVVPPVTAQDAEAESVRLSREARTKSWIAACTAGRDAGANLLLATPDVDDDDLIGEWLGAARKALRGDA